MARATNGSGSGAINVSPSSRQGVELFRQRLAIFWGTIVALCGLSFLVTQALAVFSLGNEARVGLTHPGTAAELASTLFVAFVWYWSRYREPSQRTLELLDVLAVFVFCGGGALMAYFAPGAPMPALEAGSSTFSGPSAGLLAVVAILIMRGALIPSSPWRTAIVSTLGALPLIVVALVLAARDPTPAGKVAMQMTVLVSVLIIPFPTIISAVIYRLQQQVDEAKQLGQYTLEAKIGEGGMGVVYRASHALLRRPTAIKLLPPERAGAEALSRFKREVQQTSRLAHPNTVAIYDFGTTESGTFYYAMEYLDGLSLEELVQHDGPQPHGRVIHLLRQACGALAEAHAMGLVHRDIKPANLHVSNRGGVGDHLKVLDFGLVKDLGGAAQAEPHLTSAGSILGTPLYLAPETIANAEAVDGRADLYALGAVAYFVLTGSAPFRGATLVEVCSQHLHVAPEPPSQRLGREIPAELEALVLRCLAKTPAERPASARELAQALAGSAVTYPWTEDDAERWWRECGPRVLDQCARRRQAAADSGERTVAVDLDARSPVPRLETT